MTPAPSSVDAPRSPLLASAPLMASVGHLGALGSAGEFTGFEQADFDAYERQKQSSNAFTLQRRRAKDRLLALARELHKAHEEALTGFELGATEDAPSVANGRKVQAQWVYFTRNADERGSLKTLLQRTDLQSAASLFDIALHHQHASLLLRVDVEGFAMGVELASKAKVDRENLAKKLEQKWARDKLMELAQALPGAAIVFGRETVDAGSLSAEQLEGWREALLKSDAPFVLEVKLPRVDERLASRALLELVSAWMGVLAPVLRFVAWSRENDQAHVKDAIQKQKKERQEKAVTFEPGQRVTILSGLFSGRGGYIAEVTKGKAKVMVGPVSVTVDVKDLKGS